MVAGKDEVSVFVSGMELKVKSAKLFHVFVKLKLSSALPEEHPSVSVHLV